MVAKRNAGNTEIGAMKSGRDRSANFSRRLSSNSRSTEGSSKSLIRGVHNLHQERDAIPVDLEHP